METVKHNKSYIPAANKGEAPEPTKWQRKSFNPRENWGTMYNITQFAAYLGWGKQRLAQNYKRFTEEGLKTMEFPKPIANDMKGQPLWSEKQVKYFYDYCEEHGFLESRR